jgi:protein-S-isoprenylcysteine O-methyltransferase Ste14
MSKLAVFFLMVIAPAFSIFLALLGLETLDNNLLGWILLVTGIVYPAGGAIYYFVKREPFWQHTRAQVLREEKGDCSFWGILPGFLLVFFAPPVEWIYLPAVLPRASWLQIIGLILILAGVILRVWARSHIRGLYSGHVEVQSDARVVRSGPYRFIRHPGYSGFLLMALGIALGYSSWIGLVSIPAALLPGLLYRIKIEEALLMEHFGEEYRQYTRETRKRLIPGIL